MIKKSEVIIIGISVVIFVVVYFFLPDNNNFRGDLIMFFQLVAAIIFSLITVKIAYLTFNLQKQVNKMEMEKKEELKTESASNVLNYLLNVIIKISDISLDTNEIGDTFKNSEKYIKDISYINNRIINNNEYNFLLNIIDLINRYSRNSNPHGLIKVLYKRVLDINMSSKRIYDLKRNNNFADIVSPEMLTIFLKLQNYLNKNENKNDTKNNMVSVETEEDNLIIRKEYNNNYYININNGIIDGFIERYEPVFNSPDNSKIRYVDQLIYVGPIKNSKFEGKGTYYYCSKKFSEDRINSCDLKNKGTNYDDNAQFILKLLEENNIPIEAKATFSGTFKNGLINKGSLSVKIDNQGKEKVLKINL